MGLFDGIFGKRKASPEEAPQQKPPELQAAASGSPYAVFEVQDVYFIMGVGIIPVGKVVEGVLCPGFRAIVNGKSAQVKRIEARHIELPSAGPGESVGVLLTGVEKSDLQHGMRLTFTR